MKAAGLRCVGARLAIALSSARNAGRLSRLRYKVAGAGIRITSVPEPKL